MRRRSILLMVAAVLVATAFPPGAWAQAPVKLTFWSWRSEDKWAYDKMIQVFEQRNPGIKVEFVPFRQTEYNTILSSGLTAGKAADILHLRAYGGLGRLPHPATSRRSIRSRFPSSSASRSRRWSAPAAVRMARSTACPSPRRRW
ncbi:MAG: hypothetical protein QN178_04520 [Armatimonadota bacterium]|nr:hypothetical protein [Armatimonadota bacterium]